MATPGKTFWSMTNAELQAGFPLQQYRFGTPMGNIYFVHADGTNSGGRTPVTAFTTIDAAINACTASNDDCILVLPGHTETITAAAGIDADVAGISIIGLGRGAKRPVITLGTANTCDIDIDAADITFENLVFVANFLDIAAAIDVNSTGFTMRNCECRDTSTVLNAKIWVLGATSTTSNTMTVEGCRFYATGDANTSCVSTPGTSDKVRIVGNEFQGDWGSAAILSAGVITNAFIVGNFIRNLDAGDDVCINVADNSTGICAYNAVGALETDNSTDQITVGTKMVVIQNYSVDIGDRSGLLDPAVT